MFIFGLPERTRQDSRVKFFQPQVERQVWRKLILKLSYLSFCRSLFSFYLAVTFTEKKLKILQSLPCDTLALFLFWVGSRYVKAGSPEKATILEALTKLCSFQKRVYHRGQSWKKLDLTPSSVLLILFSAGFYQQRSKKLLSLFGHITRSWKACSVYHQIATFQASYQDCYIQLFTHYLKFRHLISTIFVNQYNLGSSWFHLIKVKKNE